EGTVVYKRKDEHDLAKVGVESSSIVSRSKFFSNKELQSEVKSIRNKKCINNQWVFIQATRE
ncbi:hypothetical protein, partial [Yersinia pseudotuberculosis]|uniref:hypothetical protein n=1 Tax=Yersinia pseudotuberculosis TaxID=633 RepID=UPI001C628ED4